jgi:hypothetical protein
MFSFLRKQKTFFVAVMHTEQMDLCSGQNLALCTGNPCFENGHINGYQDLDFRGFLSPSNNNR